MIKSPDIETRLLGINLIPELSLVKQGRTRFKRRVMQLVNKINCHQEQGWTDIHYLTKVLIKYLSKKDFTFKLCLDSISEF